ncbi:MAG TPA: cupin domain-containing protein [Gammaproteobacteria bacterium]|nr:cupin domain-containing protein [Gammaproteobacteria bacterium]
MKALNLIEKGLSLEGWQGEVVAELGDVVARLFHLTPNKEMVMDEEGHEVNEWIVVLQGEVKVQTSHGNLVLKTGDSFIMPPGYSHRLNVDKPAIGLIVRDMKKAPTHPIPGAVVDR